MADDPRARILAAAEELFGARSYADTRVAEVAAAAGVATGSVYRHFADKRDLLVEVLRELNRQLRQAMSAAIDGASGQREVERRAFGAFFTFLAAHPYLFRIQRQVEFVAPAVHREYFEELARRYARGAKDAMVAGEVDPSFDPELIGYVYLGVAHFTGMRWVEWTGGAPFPPDVAEQLFGLLARALAPPGRAH